MKSLYEILGVPVDAPAEVIKRAYRNLVKTAHPDAGGDPEEFVAIVHAYDVLMDPDERAYYDANGVEREAPADADQEAVHIITLTLSRIIGSLDEHSLEMTDVLAAMQTDIGAAQKRAVDIINKQLRLRDKLAKLRKRFKHKGKSLNIIDGQIAMQIAACDQQIEHSKQEQKDIERAMEMLEDYSFDSIFGGFTSKGDDEGYMSRLEKQYQLAAKAARGG